MIIITMKDGLTYECVTIHTAKENTIAIICDSRESAIIRIENIESVIIK